MARDMGRGIIAPDNNDNIGTGASEMRTLGATTAAAITDVDRRATARVGTLETVTGAHSQELTEVMRRTSENRLDLERLETEGIEGLKGDPGEPGPGGSIALEETDPGCFVDSEITWMQWPESGGLPAVWNPNTETYENPIRVDTSVGTRVFVGDTMIYGDTGRRDMAGSLRDSWEAVSASQLSLELSRENNTVHLEGRIAFTGADGTYDKTSGRPFLNLPSGFIPSSTVGVLGVAGYYAAATHSSARDLGYIYAISSTLRIQFPSRNENWFTNQAFGFNISWKTANPWPLPDPGTPA